MGFDIFLKELNLWCVETLQMSFCWYVYACKHLNKMWLTGWGVMERNCHKLFPPQFPCVVEQDAKLFIQFIQTNSIINMKFLFKISNMWHISVPSTQRSEVTSCFPVGSPDNSCLFSHLPLARQRPCAASTDHPTRGHRSPRTYRNRKPDFLRPLQNTETCFLCTSHIGKALA